MEQNFNTIFKDVRHERSLSLLLGLSEPSILEQSKFTDHETDIIKNIAPQRIQRQQNLKELVASDLLEKQIDDNI